MKRHLLIVIGTVLLAGVLAAAVTAAVQTTAQPGPDTEPELEEFVPSEELPADSAISFPVDI
jgi:hypothetical protein